MYTLLHLRILSGFHISASPNFHKRRRAEIGYNADIKITHFHTRKFKVSIIMFSYKSIFLFEDLKKSLGTKKSIIKHVFFSVYFDSSLCCQ